MPQKTVYSDDFEWHDDRLTHKPTGACFRWAYPNSESSSLHINYGSAGDLLSDGTCYDREDVLFVARRLLEEKRRKI